MLDVFVLIDCLHKILGKSGKLDNSAFMKFQSKKFHVLSMLEAEHVFSILSA